MTFLHIMGVGCFVFMLVVLTVCGKNLPDPESPNNVTDSTEWDILMRGAKPRQPDSYFCTAYPVQFDEGYVYKFEALADASTAHHMLLYGCDGEERSHKGPIWKCPTMCKGGQTIMFAWAKNAKPTVLPKDVGLKIGKQSTIKTLVLQIHYAKSFKADAKPDNSGLKLYITNKRPFYKAGIYLMIAGYFRIPPHQPSYPVDISCQYKRPNTLVPFAYRAHAHGLGKVITGYQFNGTYNQIGKGNPQWPQAFYPVQNKVEIKQNDFLAGRCTYDSTGSTTTTRVGGTHNDEMCNFYIMYYTDSTASDAPLECGGNMYKNLTGNFFPDDVSVPLPHNSLLEDQATGKHHHHSDVATDPLENDDSQESPPKDESFNGDSRVVPPQRRQQYMYTGHNNGGQSNLEHSIRLNQEPKADKSEKDSHSSNGRNRDGEQKDSAGNEYRVVHPENSDMSENRNGMDLDHFYYDNINPRDLSHKSRMNQEYYDDYAANDWREQLQNGDRNSDVELSRNRNKDFDAMNQQLQQQFPQNGDSNSRPQASQQERGHLSHASRMSANHRGSLSSPQTGQSGQKNMLSDSDKQEDTPRTLQYGGTG